MIYQDSGTGNFLRLTLAALEQTRLIGRCIGELAAPGDIVLLTGPLGAGKTTMTQYIGEGAAVPTECYITSPTYSLMHEYPGRIPLYHLDLYRLDNEDELEELGFFDYIYGEGLTIIEWPDRLGSLTPEEFISLTLGIEKDGKRSLKIKALGDRYAGHLNRLADLPQHPELSGPQDPP